MHDYPPGIAMIRRQLGHHARELRERHGLTVVHASTQLGRSRPTLWKLETGRPVIIRHHDITALCQLYDATPAETALLQSLAAATRITAWATTLTDLLPAGYDLTAELEATAHTLHHYTDRLIPDLLQTPAYTHTLLTHTPAPPDEQHTHQHLAQHLHRTRRITRHTTSLHVDAVLTDTVLHRPIGDPTTMTDQLHHLLALTDLPNITLRILPTNLGHHPGLTTGPFSILHFPDTPPVAHTPGHTNAYWDRPTDLTPFTTTFTTLTRQALTPDASTAFIAALLGQQASTGASTTVVPDGTARNPADVQQC